MEAYARSVNDVVKEYNSSKDKGLTSADVTMLLKEHGKNILKQYKAKSKLKILFDQFNSLLIYILLAASFVSFIIGHFVDAVVILVIVCVNAIIGFVQEYKAEEIIEKLKKSLNYRATVIRDGSQVQVDSKELVPGDIILYNAGDKILSDARIIVSDNAATNEAALSGESFPLEKNEKLLPSKTPLSKRSNMLFAGTSLVRGKVTAIVTATAHDTEFGKLADLVQTTVSEKTPLLQKLDRFSKQISLVVLAVVAVAFVVGLVQGFDLVEMFLVSVSLAIGAIPEGLPAIIAITLAVAIRQMYGVNTLVRKLSSAEGLGSATVICTDKTGTLTEEQLVVDKVYATKEYRIAEMKKMSGDALKVFEIGLLCNNAQENKGTFFGDPTDMAFLKTAKRFSLDKAKIIEQNPLVKEYPFDSARKMMTLVRKSKANPKIITSYVKGAPGVILSRCTKEYRNGKIILLSKERKKELERVTHNLESEGLRVIATAFRQISVLNQKSAENNLIFTGFAGMLDPPRPEVKQAITEAQTAGITIKVITGDALLTTKTICKKIGLSDKGLEGSEIENLSDEELITVIRQNTIFARVTPKQKLRIVEALRKEGEVTAVTGDGVNDILALKKADIGVSMGIRGSDVARDSSDMVLLDDNFASIVSAVREGRRIFANLKKSIKFLLAANAGEVFAVLLTIILGYPLIFLPLAILWMNLVTDSLPALALAVEPAEEDIMKRKPQKNSFLKGITGWIVFAGVLMLVASVAVFHLGLKTSSLEVARTMAITTAIFFELFFAFACKSDKSLLRGGFTKNNYLIYAVIISAGLHLLAIYTVLGSVFSFVPLTLHQLGMAVGASAIGLIAFECWKLFKKDNNS